MAVKLKEREYRNFKIEMREQHPDSLPDFKVEGYACTYSPYVLYDDGKTRYMEQIDPHAFDESDMSDVIFQYNHDGMVYARQRNGTLEVTPDEHGLHIVADLSQTSAARGLYESIAAGMIDQMSFAFTVTDDSYDRVSHTRTILRIGKVYDVSAVSFPANPDTDISAVSARDYVNGVIDAERAERLEREQAAREAEAQRKAAEAKKPMNQSTNRGGIHMTYRDLEGLNIVGIDNKLSDLAEERSNLTTGEISEEINTQLKAIDAQVNSLTARKAELEAMEQRKADAHAVENGAGVVREAQTGKSAAEIRAEQLLATGRIEFRQLLSTGVLIPAAVKQDIGELPETMSTIVDDVHSFSLDGNAGSWQYAYRTKDSAAAKVENEGEKLPGESGAFGKGEIKPETWAILDEISNQVKHFTPLAYEASVRNNAYLALRRYAKKAVTKAIATSELVDKVITLAIDENFLRNLVLGFNADESVAGGAKLYLTKKTLAKLGAIRGTENKRALYEISFDDENNGTIQEGGLSVRFSILSDLGDEETVTDAAGGADVMIYGQMQSVDLPLWGNYVVETDEGGGYFARNMMGIRGIQSAGCDVVRQHTVQLITVNP